MNLKRANQLFQQEKYEDALLLYERIVLNEPSLTDILDFNIRVAKKKLANNPLQNSTFDILATIWLSNDEPIHDILKESMQSLNDKCITSKLFAPSPLINSVYNDDSFDEVQAASIYLSRPLIPSGTNLPASFIERNKQLVDYLRIREKQWLSGNNIIQPNDSFDQNFLRGIRYWTRIVISHSPKLMLIWGSSSPVSLFLIEVCKILSIKYQIIERGLIPGTLIVDDNQQFASSYSNHLLSSTHFTKSTNANHIRLLNEYLERTDAVAYKNFNHTSSEDILNSDQPIILFIGSNDLGSAIALHDSNSPHPNHSEYQSSWKVASDLAASLPLLNNNAVLYIKPHPVDKSDYYALESKNVKVLPTHNLHELIEASTICCTLESTAIAICLLKNKPLVTFTSTDISNLGIAYEVYRQSELISQLRSSFLQTNFSQMAVNANKYFEFAVNYRLYFESKFSEYGNIASNLSQRIFMLVAKQYKKSFLSLESKINTIISPLFFTVDKICSLRPRLVDIVIPLYDGYELSRSCIEYAMSAASNFSEVNIILVNDCSPNHQLNEYLEDLSSSGIQNIKVHTNRVNTGFSGAVNIGISLSRPNADILLLNSDALISNHTLCSLQTTAYSHPKIATVCPLSTDGGLLTVPIEMPSNSPISQEQLDRINLDLLSQDEFHSVTLPVNHGACLYIKKSALNIVGQFNEFIFGRGYSEEIDFCLRLRLHGLQNVGCLFAFVQHVGGVSFGEDTNPLKIKNRKIIQNKYPQYFMEVSRFSNDLKESSLFSGLSNKINACFSDQS